MLKEHRFALDESDVATIEGRIMELKQVFEGEDVGEIRAKTDALQEASHKLVEAVYASAQQQAASSSAGSGTGTGTGSGASAPSDDEVADAEIVDEPGEQTA